MSKAKNGWKKNFPTTSNAQKAIPNLKLLSNEAYGRQMVQISVDGISRMIDEAKKEAVYNAEMFTTAACLLACRELFGFGQQRCKRLAEKIIENVALQIDGFDDVQKVFDEIGLDINFSNVVSIEDIDLITMSAK